MRKKTYFLLISFFIAVSFGETCNSQDIVTDIDGNSYPTIKIGDQIWMAKNLASTRYSNGDTITSFCYHHDTSFCRVYGRLYPWNAIVGGIDGDSLLGICPRNWHVPSDEDWEILIDTLGGQVYAGVKLRRGRKTNFDFQWGGNYHSDLDIFSFIDRKVYFWSSTSYSCTSGWMRMTGVNYKNINRSTVPKEFAFSIRCVKD